MSIYSTATLTMLGGREEQQDAYCLERRWGEIFAAVCDGIGHPGLEVVEAVVEPAGRAIVAGERGERLAQLFGAAHRELADLEAGLEIEEGGGRYRVRIRLPYRTRD